MEPPIWWRYHLLLFLQEQVGGGTVPFLHLAVHGSVGRDAVVSPERLSKAHIYVGLCIWYTAGSYMSNISTQKLDFVGEKWEVGTTCGSREKDNGSLILLPQQSLGMYLLIIFPFSLSLLGLELEGQMHRLGRLPALCSTK